MPSVLVVAATSSEAVPPLERLDWVLLPAEGGVLRRVLLNMLSVDEWLRRLHRALAREGYGHPLGPEGCRAWLMDATANEVSRRRDARRIAEDLSDGAFSRATVSVSYDGTTADGAVEVLIREAARVSHGGARPIGQRIARSCRFSALERLPAALVQ